MITEGLEGTLVPMCNTMFFLTECPYCTPGTANLGSVQFICWVPEEAAFWREKNQTMDLEEQEEAVCQFASP